MMTLHKFLTRHSLLSHLGLLVIVVCGSIRCNHSWLISIKVLFWVLLGHLILLTVMTALHWSLIVKSLLRVAWWHHLVSGTLHYGFFNINSSTIDLSDWIVLNQIACGSLFCEGDEAKTSGLSSIYIFQNDSVNYIAKMVEMLFKFLGGQFKVKATNENL